jgi:hypothetical protein
MSRNAGLALLTTRAEENSHLIPRGPVGDDLSSILNDPGSTTSGSAFSLNYADLQGLFDQDLTFLNDMVF